MRSPIVVPKPIPPFPTKNQLDNSRVGRRSAGIQGYLEGVSIGFFPDFIGLSRVPQGACKVCIGLCRSLWRLIEVFTVAINHKESFQGCLKDHGTTYRMHRDSVGFGFRV